MLRVIRAASALMCCATLCAAAATAFPIVEDGVAQVAVVIPNDPHPIARYAADELVYHVEKSTGVELPVVEESAAPEEPARRIFIGSTAQAELAGVDVSALETEAFVIQLDGDNLLIAGEDGPGDPLSTGHGYSGTLWGVYDFLDNELGVRWLWPGELGTYVPKRDTFVAHIHERTVAPRFHWQRLRQGFYGHKSSIGFSQEGLEAYREAETVFVRRYRMSQRDRPRFGHMFSGWWDRYGEDHPEWFQEVDGVRGPRAEQRSPDAFSMCVSNPGLHDKVFEDWKAAYEEAETTPTLSLPEADSRGWCECADCLAWDAPQPSEAELETMTYSMQRAHHPRDTGQRYARFWQIMHDRAAEVAPDVRTTAYVYFNYFVAPAEPIRFSSAVHLDFVPWVWFWFPRPIQEQEWVKEQWIGWRETGASMSYRPNFLHDGYVMPHVYARQFADMFQFVERHGAVGTDFDTLRGQWATQGPTLYLLARLHVRPRATTEELLTEYYQAFGPAADAVRAYFDYWEAHTTANLLTTQDVESEYEANRFRSYARTAHVWFPPESFEMAQQMLNKAAESVAAEPDGEYAQRVDFLQTGLDHARMAAELAALFDDEDVSEEERATAYSALAEFRRANEGLFFSNLTHASHVETQSWSNRAGFIGE